MTLTLQSAVARYGAQAKAKLHNVAASGEPEDQLRAPLEELIDDLAELCGLPRNAVTAVGESSLADLKTRPDYAITLRNALVGFIEIKAPGKGADPRKYRGHDKEQWDKLQSLPNLIYTDGNQLSLWRSGQLDGAILTLKGDVETSGSSLAAPSEFLGLFDNFLHWEPIPLIDPIYSQTCPSQPIDLGLPVQQFVIESSHRQFVLSTGPRAAPTRPLPMTY